MSACSSRRKGDLMGHMWGDFNIMAHSNTEYLALVEIAGTRALSESIAYRSEGTGLDSATAILLLRKKLVHMIEISKGIADFDITEWGSDSLIIRFFSIGEALSVSRNILQRSYLELLHGSSILKPMVAITKGTLLKDGNNPVDRGSISLHEAIETRPIVPFSLQLHESIIEETKAYLGSEYKNLTVISNSAEVKTREGTFYRFHHVNSSMSHDNTFFHKQILDHGLKTFDSLISGTDRTSFCGYPFSGRTCKFINTSIWRGTSSIQAGISQLYRIRSRSLQEKRFKCGLLPAKDSVALRR